jgi:hypothetical protein
LQNSQLLLLLFVSQRLFLGFFAIRINYFKNNLIIGCFWFIRSGNMIVFSQRDIDNFAPVNQEF